jgi:Tfp pilus assembly protein PilF
VRPAPLVALAWIACLPSPRLHPRAAEELRRGYAYLEAGDVERAEVAFAHALEFHPDLPEAWNGAGVAAQRRGDPDLARSRFERAARAPDFAEARVNLGVVSLESGRPDAAEDHLRAALSIDPDLAVARLDLARALLHRGRAEPTGRESLWQRARVEYLHLLETRGDLADAWHDLGYMDFESGRFARAEQEYRRAAEIEPGSPAALHGLCIALVRLARCRDAAAECRRCLALAPGSAECRRSLAGAQACGDLPLAPALSPATSRSRCRRRRGTSSATGRPSWP